MLPFLAALKLAKKAYNFRESRKSGNVNDFGEKKPKKPMTPKGKLRLFAALPVVITAIAFILSIFCVYAGRKPGMMDDYAVFTLNTSRVGENVRQDLIGKVKSVDIKFKRSEPELIEVPVAMITPVPTTMVTMAPRDLLSDLESMTDKAGDKVSSKASSAKSGVSSKASSAQSAAKSAANSAVANGQGKVIDLINKSYRAAIEGLSLEDLYNVHISSSCIGTYVYEDDNSYTAGDSKNLDELKPRIDSCEGHSAVNPFQLVRVIYWIGIVLTAITLLLGLTGIVRPTKKMVMINIFGTLPALVVFGLASAVTHGIAIGAAKLITFVGEKVGITGVAGQKFLQVTWAVTIMLLINLCFWAIIFFLIGRMAKKAGGEGSMWGRKRPDRTSTIALGEISRPEPVHIDRNGQPMF